MITGFKTVDEVDRAVRDSVERKIRALVRERHEVTIRDLDVHLSGCIYNGLQRRYSHSGYAYGERERYFICFDVPALNEAEATSLKLRVFFRAHEEVAKARPRSQPK